VLRYVKGTNDYRITYKHNRGNTIQGFSDSSYGVNTQEGKGTTGIIFYYGDSPISWSTQKQATVALSSCESEFIATTTAATQALWLKRLLSRLTHSREENITIMVDNKSNIALMKNLVFHGRSKHIDTNELPEFLAVAIHLLIIKGGYMRSDKGPWQDQEIMKVLHIWCYAGYENVLAEYKEPDTDLKEVIFDGFMDHYWSLRSIPALVDLDGVVKLTGSADPLYISIGIQ
nr:ribonuclease H-like domain, reverse transcriptase, RNA-dependent DNA polymerase [Tanacetum cinerariifolium]